MLGPLGNGVIDANEDFVLSFQVNGNSPLVRFGLFIVGADEPSQIVLGRTLEQPFYGTDYAGNVQMFHANLESLSITNGKSYKLRIRQYWSETEYVDQQSQSTFITRDRPTISFLGDFYDGSSFNQKSVTFRAKYTQKQGDGINWVRWRIAEEPENYTTRLSRRTSSETQAIFTELHSYNTRLMEFSPEKGILCSVLSSLRREWRTYRNGFLSVGTTTRKKCLRHPSRHARTQRAMAFG